MQTLESFQIAFATAINYLNRPLKKQRFTVIVVNETAINSTPSLFIPCHGKYNESQYNIFDSVIVNLSIMHYT